MDKVNLAEKFGLFDDHWSPKIVGELNGQHVLLAKVRGAFIWHQHEAQVLLFEPQDTAHTGNVRSEQTVDKFERI